MKNDLISNASVTINAPSAKVWEALTTPAILKQFFFGADIITDWKVGSSIVYKGVWEGKPFEDKGTVLEFVPEKRLVTSHWSPLSGTPDSPENYHKVSYELSKKKDGIQVTITQDNNASEQEAKQGNQSWKTLLDGLKTLLEG